MVVSALCVKMHSYKLTYRISNLLSS